MLLALFFYVKLLTIYTMRSIIYLGGEGMEDKIKEFKKVITALTELILEIGTLLAVIKMVVESLL